MKRSVFTVLLACFICALTAQTPVVNVPPSVNVKFGSDYPNVSPVWSMENNYYYATWTDNATRMGKTTVYDKNGNVISTENELSSGSWPVTINDYYTKNYPEENNYRVWSSTDGKGNTTYYTKRNGQRVQGRPWTEVAIASFNVEETYAQRYRINGG